MGRIKYIIVINILSIITCELSGQSVPDSSRISLGYPVYSQYLQNGLVINPAYAGSREALCGMLSYRMQWMGTPGAPVLQSVTLHTPMKNERVALGLNAQFMQYGLTKSSGIYAVYAYHIRIGKGKLSFGLKAGADMSNTDYTGLLLTNAGDPVFTSDEKPYVLPNAGAGMYYFSKRLFAGFSVPSFLSYKRTDTGSTQAYHSFNEYDLIISAGGLITFSQDFKFKPSVLIDYSLQETKNLTQLDINGNFIIADLVWAGASWRTTEEVIVGIIQVQPTPQLMIGLSYDYPAGRMNSYSKGSTEFILRYEFGSKVSAANPRYF
jgi:type IX secretion system PorP/SprF family membrane protein